MSWEKRLKNIKHFSKRRQGWLNTLANLGAPCFLPFPWVCGKGTTQLDTQPRVVELLAYRQLINQHLLRGQLQPLFLHLNSGNSSSDIRSAIESPHPEFLAFGCPSSAEILASQAA